MPIKTLVPVNQKFARSTTRKNLNMQVRQGDSLTNGDIHFAAEEFSTRMKLMSNNTMIPAKFFGQRVHACSCAHPHGKKLVDSTKIFSRTWKKLICAGACAIAAGK